MGKERPDSMEHVNLTRRVVSGEMEIPEDTGRRHEAKGKTNKQTKPKKQSATAGVIGYSSNLQMPLHWEE